ncbi:DUF4229 domain-containing protein [Microbacterium sp. X-17]|uniref:DUF4229 domain-containing protein n=1 Tax=Microbacterium sp. X-17 TaxID=3144404 RepID=UPI0031F59F6A
MRVRSAVLYTVLRLLAFLVPFGILMLFPVFQQLYWLAAIFAALIGLSISIIFLRRPLNAVTSGFAERRAARPPKAARAGARARDTAVEDAAADAVREDQTTKDQASSAE